MRLIVFGLGYSAKALLRLLPDDTRVFATTRSQETLDQWRGTSILGALFPGEEDKIAAELAEATHVLVSIPPVEGEDIVVARMRDALVEAAPRLDWVGYLSTTGVYGDHDGGWVDESTPLTGSTRRGQARIAAETAWMDLYRDHGLPLHIFRLAGIYGPGRGPFAKVRNGTARRIIKEGQVFSRTHVEDIAQVLLASIHRPNPGAAYNVCDDDPAPPQDVIAHAAELLGLPVPEAIPFDEAELGPMARSFYAESKRVRNDRIKDELGVRLRYPTYREGLAALLSAETDGNL
ncbi:SDR family oxidoreductase [Maritalea mobilis]|uniref:SDR family oxidoreductase n=1 Tax=Maritalea mobilis TaxID=483324 RepID=UPI001C988A65|nr:SDR family oxidoreductase [Maritalea mobilis]MBY6201491.1 SDR family oxidoreductase [Maritalea mobilis]